MNIRDTLIRLLRPVVHGARRVLQPPTAVGPTSYDWHTIQGGPAQGCQVILPVGSLIANNIATGQYETQCLKVVQAMVKQTDVCYDIGGHYGYYTFCLAKFASAGQTITFEPVKSHADRIAEGITRSQLPNSTVLNVAVAGQPGEMQLRFASQAGSDDSMAYLEAYGGVNTEAASEHYANFSNITVNAVTLDSLELPKPNFIKIDAEGAESAILAGGRQLLATARPHVLLEAHGIDQAIQCADVMTKLKYRAILFKTPETTLPVLWIPLEDTTTAQHVAEATGLELTSCFDGLSQI